MIVKRCRVCDRAFRVPSEAHVIVCCETNTFSSATGEAIHMPHPGVALWTEAHTKQDAEETWFNDWIDRVKKMVGCDCEGKLPDLMQQHPPRFGTEWFAYSVELHNAVSATLQGKRQWSVEEAREHWQG